MKKRNSKMVQWLRSWDSKLWGEDFVGSSWLGVATILIAAVAGAILTIVEGGIDDVMFIYAILLALVVIIESVLSAKSVKVAVGRSLLMASAVVIAMLAGIVSVVVCIVAVIVINLTSGSSRKGRISIDGEEVSESSDLVGFGKSYQSKTSDRKWHSTDGGNTATEE